MAYLADHPTTRSDDLIREFKGKKEFVYVVDEGKKEFHDKLTLSDKVVVQAPKPITNGDLESILDIAERLGYR